MLNDYIPARVYCPVCDKYWEERELEIKTYGNGGNDLVCPRCGEYEELIDEDIKKLNDKIRND